METIFAHAELEDYGDDDKALPTSELLIYAGAGDSVFMVAADGYEKTEEREVFAAEYIVTTGDTAPAFRGPDLPRRQHVRDLVWLAVGDAAFYSVNRGPELLDTTTAGERTGVSLAVLAEADAYVLEAADGFSVEVTGDDLNRGVVYIRDDTGQVASAFDDLPRRANVRDLLSIRAVFEDPADQEIITMVDPSGAEQEFTLGEIRRLPPVTETVTRRDDTFEVTGVLLDTLCAEVDVSMHALKGLTLTAGDDYAVEVPTEVLTSYTVIFAYEIDGEPLIEGTAPLRAYMPGSEARYWARNLVRIELVSDAASMEAADRAEVLNSLDLLLGVDPDVFTPDLHSALDRSAAMVMVARALGWTQAADWDSDAVSGFSDVPDWAQAHVACAVEKGVTVGVGSDQFGDDRPVTARQLQTWFDRAMGHGDTWFANSHLDDETPLTRVNMVNSTWDALKQVPVGCTRTLIKSILGDDEAKLAIAVEGGLIDPDEID